MNTLKSIVLLALIGMFASAAVSVAYYDDHGHYAHHRSMYQDGNRSRRGLFGWRRGERDYYDDGYYGYNEGPGIVRDAAYDAAYIADDAVEGAGEVVDNAVVGAGNIVGSIFGR